MRGSSSNGSFFRGVSADSVDSSAERVRNLSLLPALLCLFLFLLATADGAGAKTLTFAGTSVKELSAPGENWSEEMPAVLHDRGKGLKYIDSEDEVGVALLDEPVPAPTGKLFDAKPGSLSPAQVAKSAWLTPAQVAELSKSENPWILRYCVERGKPYLAPFGKKKFIGNEFIQEQRIRVRTAGGGAQCLSACKVEAHAFALSGGKMVHVYWVRSVMRDAKTQPDNVILKDLATKFRAMLATIRWE